MHTVHTRHGADALDPASERAYRHLQRTILTGEIPGGTRLVEGQLAAQFGVSRTPVREALRRLAQDGIVEFVPRSGAIVKLITAEDITRAYGCRAVLEGLAARLACARRTERHLFDLREVQSQALQALAERRLEDLLALNGRFHETLLAVAGDSMIRELLDHLVLYTHQYRQTILGLSRASEQAKDRYIAHVRDVVAEHDQLLDLVVAKNGEAAERLARRHLEATADEMAQLLRAFGDRPGGTA